MVIKHFIALVFCLMTITSFAGFLDYHNEGVKAYKVKDFEKAVSYFNSEIIKNPTNSSAYFNLGLSYNAQKNYAKSIWAFEKVLKLEPNNLEAIENIEQNYLELDNGESWISPMNNLERFMYGLSSSFWAFGSVFLSILFSVLLILLNRSTSLKRKRAFLSGIIVVGILMIYSIYTSSEANYFMTTNDYAIVTKGQIRISPEDNSLTRDKTERILEVGAKVKQVGNSKGLMIQVETMNNQRYFINKDDIDFI